MIRKKNDVFGVELMDFYEGHEGTEIVERDDGYLEATAGPAIYFADYRDWHRQEKQAFKQVSGRVLDVGAGAGRHSLYLQEKGFDVLAIDKSSLAVKLCQLRGVAQVKRVALADVPKSRLGVFDTILMLGNNFGLFGSRENARMLLRDFLQLTTDDARMVVQCMDPYLTAEPAHLAYQRMNWAKGRMGGQLCIRIRYKTACSDWFDFLTVSPTEIVELVNGTGWYAAHCSKPEDGMFTTILRRVRGA